MTTLENLYNGNINPCEAESLKSNPKYKQSLSLVGQAQSKLIESLTEEQKKLFDNYLTNAEELSVITDEEIFKVGFSLAVKIMTEVGNIEL